MLCHTSDLLPSKICTYNILLRSLSFAQKYNLSFFFFSNDLPHSLKLIPILMSANRHLILLEGAGRYGMAREFL